MRHLNFLQKPIDKFFIEFILNTEFGGAFVKKPFCFLFIICFFEIYAQEMDMWDFWEATDSVVISNKIYEYELYSVSDKDLDAAVPQLVADFWGNDGDWHDASFSRNRSTVYANNTGLSTDVKRMMTEMKVNISTTKYFLIDGDRYFLYFTVNYTKDFKTFSTWVSWDEINPWRS
jgi:hypothetical protein